MVTYSFHIRFMASLLNFKTFLSYRCAFHRLHQENTLPLCFFITTGTQWGLSWFNFPRQFISQALQQSLSAWQRVVIFDKFFHITYFKIAQISCLSTWQVARRKEIKGITKATMVTFRFLIWRLTDFWISQSKNVWRCENIGASRNSIVPGVVFMEVYRSRNLLDNN